jgi:hypothetical protein
MQPVQRNVDPGSGGKRVGGEGSPGQRDTGSPRRGEPQGGCGVDFRRWRSIPPCVVAGGTAQVPSTGGTAVFQVEAAGKVSWVGGVVRRAGGSRAWSVGGRTAVGSEGGREVGDECGGLFFFIGSVFHSDFFACSVTSPPIYVGVCVGKIKNTSFCTTHESEYCNVSLSYNTDCRSWHPYTSMLAKSIMDRREY